MECSTIDQIDSYDWSWGFYRKSTVKARKLHRCGECRRLIFPGEKYEYVVGTWEGEITPHKTCMDCVSVRANMFKSYYYNGIIEGVYDEISNTFGDINQTCIARMTPAGRAMVCRMIEEYWEENEDEDEHEA